MLGKKLIGSETIRLKLGWSRKKLYSRLNSLREAGAVMYELSGQPPQRKMVAFEGLLERYVCLLAQEQYRDDQEKK